MLKIVLRLIRNLQEAESQMINFALLSQIALCSGNRGIPNMNVEENSDNIATWASEHLRGNHTRLVHEKLISVRGVGRKIASLHLGNIVWLSEVTSECLRDSILAAD